MTIGPRNDVSSNRREHFLIKGRLTIPLALVAASLHGCGETKSSSDEALTVLYSLTRQYTALPTDELTLDVLGGSDDRYTFSLYSATARSSVEQDTPLPLVSQSILLSYATEGVHFVDFKVQKETGLPYIFEILTWEFSTEIPDVPLISFDRLATNTLTNNLLVSETRSANTTEIWAGGDVNFAGKAGIDDDGYWQDLKMTDKVVRVALSPGDGPKVVQGKFRNIFGSESGLAVPAEIILKQTPPTGCSADLLTPVIGNNKVSIKMSAVDPYRVFYSVTGSVKSVVNERAFTSGEVVFVYVSPQAGTKTITVFITDIAGNICLTKDMTITVDPTFESERIDVVDHPNWTDTENVVLDVFFDHFADQEPLQLKITGDVAGANTNAWIPYGQGVAVTLNPTTSGRRTIFAQYKDVAGVESYLIAKSIFLKPTLTLLDAGGGLKNVVASAIPGISSVTIAGCVETYTNVAYQASFPCQPNPLTITFTYTFANGSTLTKTAP